MTETQDERIVRLRKMAPKRTQKTSDVRYLTVQLTADEMADLTEAAKRESEYTSAFGANLVRKGLYT